MERTADETWEQRAYNKRAALLSLIPPEWQLTDLPSPHQCPNVIDWPRSVLTSDEVLITESPPLIILANIHASTWSAERVTRAFCHRAAIAQQLTNCLTEFLFDSAITTAQNLDRYQQDSGRLQGPLHGLPVSFMDRFRIAGAGTSAGFIAWLGPKESVEAESLLVQHMRQLGAIPFCKTNVPQSLMLANTSNNIFGSTLNPYNRKLSAGGAAGGEAALLAMRGSPLGWATEIAGSARIPAVYNNLFALRVSVGRLPILGIASSNPALPLCNITVGIMCWDLPFLQHISRLTLGAAAYQRDPMWLDMPWRESRFQMFASRKPTLAVLIDDGHVRPQPPLSRVLSQLTQRLRHQGFEVIDWKPPSHHEAVETLFRMIGADGATYIRANIARSGEPPVQQLRKWFLEQQDVPGLSLNDYWALCKARTEYTTAYHSYWLSSQSITTSGLPVDGVIMPVMAQVACHENGSSYFGYSAIVNYLDFASVAVPLTFVDQEQHLRVTSRGMLNAEDAQNQTAYDPALFHGMPVGLQIMCRRVQEECALALAGILYKAFRGIIHHT